MQSDVQGKYSPQTGRPKASFGFDVRLELQMQSGVQGEYSPQTGRPFGFGGGFMQTGTCLVGHTQSTRHGTHGEQIFVPLMLPDTLGGFTLRLVSIFLTH
jgi:hypothetical protein